MDNWIALMRKGQSINKNIMSRKDIRSPEAVQKLLEFSGVAYEEATFFQDNEQFPSEAYYDAIDEFQLAQEEKRKEEPRRRKKPLEFQKAKYTNL